MRKVLLLNFIILSFLLAGCSLPSQFLPISQQVRITEYPPLDWSINGQEYTHKSMGQNLTFYNRIKWI